MITQTGTGADHLVVHLSAAPGPVRTVLLHPAGGGVLPYLPLAAHLAEFGPVSAVRGQGLMPGEEPDDTVAAMVRRYLPAVEALAPDVVVGWSMGGILAWELAGLLRRPTAVVAVDSRAEAAPLTAAGIAEAIHSVLEAVGRPAAAEVRHTAAAHVRANGAHTLSARQSGPALLAVCGPEPVTARLGHWDRVADGRLRVRRLPGEHFDVFTPEVLPVLLTHIDAFLRDTVLRDTVLGDTVLGDTVLGDTVADGQGR